MEGSARFSCPDAVLVTCNDSQSTGRDALARQCDIIFHFFSFRTRLPRDDAGLDAEPVIFRQCIVLSESGLWSASLLLGVYCVSIIKYVGALTKVMGGSFGAPERSAHNTVRLSNSTRALRHEENT